MPTSFKSCNQQLASPTGQLNSGWCFPLRQSWILRNLNTCFIYMGLLKILPPHIWFRLPKKLLLKVSWQKCPSKWWTISACTNCSLLTSLPQNKMGAEWKMQDWDPMQGDPCVACLCSIKRPWVESEFHKLLTVKFIHLYSVLPNMLLCLSIHCWAYFEKNISNILKVSGPRSISRRNTAAHSQFIWLFHMVHGTKHSDFTVVIKQGLAWALVWLWDAYVVAILTSALENLCCSKLA